MTSFDDPSNPHPPPEPAPEPPKDSRPESESSEPPSQLDDLASRIVIHGSLPANPQDAASEPATLRIDFSSLQPDGPPHPLPPDLAFPWPWPHLHLAWSWLHVFLFSMFAIGSIVIVQLALFLHYAVGHRPDLKQFEKFLQSRPDLAIGMNVLWFFLLLAALYISLPPFSGLSFWRTTGWFKLAPRNGTPAQPWVYFLLGIALALGVALGSSRMKTPDNLPIQDLLKSRTGAILLMSMAVFVAPLVEETVFRGYLYPLLAGSISRIARFFGGDPVTSYSAGSAVSIVLTGTFFGLLHGAQLGWTWGLVGMLVTVGIIFTYTRAKTGTVLASFLMHLGYNSMIALSAIVSTHGFTRMPPHP